MVGPNDRADESGFGILDLTGGGNALHIHLAMLTAEKLQTTPEVALGVASRADNACLTTSANLARYEEDRGQEVSLVFRER